MSHLHTLQTPYWHIYRAEVIDNKDKLKSGRIKVLIPSLSGPNHDKHVWARPMSAFGYRHEKDKKNHGSHVVPEIGSYVYIFFENGDPSYPIYIGGVVLVNRLLEEADIDGPQYKEYVIHRSPNKNLIRISDNKNKVIMESKENRLIVIDDEKQLIYLYGKPDEQKNPPESLKDPKPTKQHFYLDDKEKKGVFVAEKKIEIKAEKVYIDKDVYISGNLYVKKDIYCKDIYCNSINCNSCNCKGNMNCNGGMNCGGDMKCGGNMNCGGDMKCGGNMNCGGDMKCGGNMSCNGASCNSMNCNGPLSCNSATCNSMNCNGPLSCNSATCNGLICNGDIKYTGNLLRM